MTCFLCIVGLYYPYSVKEGTERNVSTLNKKSVLCVRLCLLFCHSLQHFNTHTDTQKHSNIPFPFLITLFFCLSSVCTSEGILHPSNSPPGSFILRLGRARIPCQRLSLLLNIKSSVSRLALSSPCLAPCIFRSRRPCYKAG